jgi:hypothetical protein
MGEHAHIRSAVLKAVAEQLGSHHQAGQQLRGSLNEHAGSWTAEQWWESFNFLVRGHAEQTSCLGDVGGNLPYVHVNMRNAWVRRQTS